MANLGSNFYSKLVQIAGETGMRPEDILAVMVSESGINPAAHNPGGAIGLMQFMPRTLEGVGFHGNPREFGALSGEDQLPYIQKLIEGNMRLNGGPFTSAAQYYVAVFWPAGLKLPGVRQGDPRTPIVEENPESVTGYSKKYYDIGLRIPVSQERAAYKANPLFHGSTPGAITYGDMMHQVEKNKRNPLYSKALLAMNEQTGYQPTRVAPSMLAMRHPKPAHQSGDFMAILDQFVHYLSSAAEDKTSKKIYKKMLPNHDILIQISAPDYTSAVEFSRILCAALDEEVQATAYPHTDGSQMVEIECSIPGPALACLGAVEQLSQAVAASFQMATKKIGGISVKTRCIMNKKSSYQQISLRTAETNYRKFLLKFI